MHTTEADQTDREAMARLAQGEDGALDELIERHADRVHRFLYRMLRSEEDARDLAQEVFVRLYTSRSRYQAKRSFSTWLYTIAANLGRNQLRWRSRHPNVSLDQASESEDQPRMEQLASRDGTPDDDLQTSERTNAVREAVGSLPEPLREAVLLCQWEELSLADAAAVLKTTAKAVESRLYRARRLLRDQLRSWL